VTSPLHNFDPAPHTDGTPVYMRPADLSRKNVIASYLQAAWWMELLPMPPLAYTDFLGARHSRPCCWVTIISRNYSWQQLMDLGGIYLKWRTWATLRQLSAVPLSISWLGSYVVYDLTDGLYSQHIMNIADNRATAVDPRGAAGDIEAAVLVTRLERIG
jgi:hypothetical protein